MNVLSAGKNLLDLVMFEKNGKFEKISEAEARQLLSEGFLSTVGLNQTAELFTARLGFDIRVGKEAVTITPEDTVIVGEYDRRVCDERKNTYPKDALIDWYRVVIDITLTWAPPPQKIVYQADF